MSITPEKIHTILTSFIHRSDKDNADGSSQVDKSLDHVRSRGTGPRHDKNQFYHSRDKVAFLDRVHSFSSLTWFAKPGWLSPLHCARYGWKNVDTDLLQCVSCQANFSGHLPAFSDPHVYDECCSRIEEMLTKGHNVCCSWASIPSPEQFLSPLPEESDVALAEFTSRASGLLAKGSVLPSLDAESLEDIDEIMEHLTQFLDTTNMSNGVDTDATESTLELKQTAGCLALCGWEVKPESKLDLLHCRLCMRDAGMWHYTTIHQEEDSDSLSSNALSPSNENGTINGSVVTEQLMINTGTIIETKDDELVSMDVSDSKAMITTKEMDSADIVKPVGSNGDKVTSEHDKTSKDSSEGVETKTGSVESTKQEVPHTERLEGVPPGDNICDMEVTAETSAVIMENTERAVTGAEDESKTGTHMEEGAPVPDSQPVSTDPELVSTDPQLVSTDPQLVSTDPQLVSTDTQLVSTDTQLVSTPIKGPSNHDDHDQSSQLTLKLEGVDSKIAAEDAEMKIESVSPQTMTMGTDQVTSPKMDTSDVSESQSEQDIFASSQSDVSSEEKAVSITGAVDERMQNETKTSLNLPECKAESAEKPESTELAESMEFDQAKCGHGETGKPESLAQNTGLASEVPSLTLPVSDTAEGGLVSGPQERDTSLPREPATLTLPQSVADGGSSSDADGLPSDLPEMLLAGNVISPTELVGSGIPTGNDNMSPPLAHAQLPTSVQDGSQAKEGTAPPEGGDLSSAEGEGGRADLPNTESGALGTHVLNTGGGDDVHKIDRKLRKSPATSEPGTQEPAVKRTKYEHKKTPFNPVSEHRMWCPWVLDASMVQSPVKLTRVSLFSAPTTPIPGWRRLLALLQPASPHKKTVRAEIKMTSTPDGLRSIRNLFQGWT